MPAPEHTIAPRTEPPGFGFFFLAGLIIIVALQGVIYLLVVGSQIGPFQLLKREQPPDPLLVREMKVALLRSELTAKMFPENPESSFSLESHWERVLTREHISFQVTSDAGLNKTLENSTVLVLPSAACLSDSEKTAIEKFLARGRGVVASGPVGTRRADCTWEGWDFLRRLTGVQNISFLTPSTTTSVAFRGQLYFSGKIPAGYRVEIPSQDLTLVTTKDADVFWTDWRLRPAQGNSLSDVGLATHRIIGTGRVVWFGFTPQVPVERVIDQNLLDRFLSSSAVWAGKQPLAILGDWPNRSRAAVLVAEEVGEDFADAEANSRLLKEEGIPAIFICPSDGAKKNLAAMKSFQAAGEIGSSGDTMEPFGGELPLRQADRLRQAKKDLEKMTGDKVAGFGPPHGLTDTATVVALNGTGYQYYLNEMSVSSAVPETVEFTQSLFFPLQKSEVAKIFRTASDDFEVIANYHGPGPPDLGLAEGFLSDFRRIYEFRGVYPLYFHSYLLGIPKYYSVLKAVLEDFKSYPVWTPTGTELVQWWSAREKIEVRARKLGAHRVQLDVSNPGQNALKNASVYLYLPYHPSRIRITSPIFRLRSPQFQMLDADDGLRVDFSDLSAQSYYTYYVGLDE